MGTEDRAFSDYRVRPGRDALIALLRSHQWTVYNVCFQVLRREHDAEDAAQETLLEVARGVDQIREPRAFKRWLCRTALHTALDHRRRRDRRARREEEKAAMTPLGPPDPAVDALHDALARLDDDDRCLLVEKYFEQSTLEQLARREGLSAAAVGKRVDKARERLKKLMAGTGMTVTVPAVDALLESIRPVAVPDDLVTSSLTLNAALAGAGGAIMGTKALISGTTIIAALIFLIVGAGSGYLVGVKRGAPPTPSDSKGGIASDPGTSRSADVPKAPAVNGDPAGKGPDPGTRSPGGENVLIARLDRFKAWAKDYDASHDVRAPQHLERRFLLLKEEMEGVHELILADPAIFLDWIGRRENGPHLGDLFDATIAAKQSPFSNTTQEFSAFPAALTDGLLALLQNGDDSQRHSIISFARYLRNPPDAYRTQFVAMLSDPYMFVGPQAAQALLSTSEPTATEVEAVVRYAERLENDVTRQQVIQGLGRVPRAETRDWLLQALESERFPDPRGRLAWAALEWWLQPGRSPDGAFEDRAARILSAALRRTTDEGGYCMSAYTALNLPLSKSLPLIEQAATGAPTEKLRKAAAAVLQKARLEGASPLALQETWLSVYHEK